MAGAADDPQLLVSRIVNAADHSGGHVAPGEIVILYPANAGPRELAGQHLDDSGKIATMAGETRVLFDGIPAPLAYTVAGEVAAVVPYEIAGRPATEIVVEYQGRRSKPATLPVVDSTPAVFTLDGSGRGQAAMLNDTGCCNSARNPATRGAVAALYATGEGQTTPSGITGNISSYARPADYPAPVLPVQVLVGGKPAPVVFAGEAAHSVAGLMQVNFRIPDDAPVGDDVPLVLIVGSARSADGVTMAIRTPVQRVMVDDPDPAVRAWFTTLLKGAGYEVAPGKMGEIVDLVIVSLAVPERDRTEMIQALRAQRRLVRIAAIVPGMGPESLRAADLMGAQTVFALPFQPALVLKQVKELLRSHPVPYVTEDIAPARRLVPGLPH
jgi:uncharacterized protein (TIGR03437 family)